MYDEIMALWKKGRIEPIAVYLNAKGIYSSSNKAWPNRSGSYEWVNPKEGSMHFDLLVCGVMLFPSELRYTERD